MNRERYDEFMIQPNECTKKIDLDIVCVYNDEYYYREKLLASLRQQKTNFVVRVLGINNIDGKYTSMASAYNDVTRCLKGKWVLFLHQDILFNTSKTLEEVIEQVGMLKNEYSIWGAYGVVCHSRLTISAKDAPIQVETLDECFFGMSVEVLKQLKFNEELCDDWHMYAVEMCLHNLYMGGQNYVIKADITHLSPGKVSKSYVRTLYKIIESYKAKGMTTIWTTCAKVNLRGAWRAYIIMWLAKHEILNKFVRPLKR